MSFDDSFNGLYDPNSLLGFDQPQDDGSGYTPAFMGDLSTYGKPQATDIATQNRQWTALANFLKTRSNPYFNEMVAQTDPTASTVFDFGGFSPGGGVTGSDLGYGNTESSIGGGVTLDSTIGDLINGTVSGGGSSRGGGKSQYDPFYDTSALDNALNSSDKVLASVAKDIQGGTKSAYEIKLGLRKLKDAQGQPLSESDPETLKTYLGAVDDLGKVATGARRNDQYGQLEGGPGFKTDKAGPLAQYWARSGMPNPAQAYDENNLPLDVESNLAQGMAGSNLFQENNKYLQENAASYRQKQSDLATFDKMFGSALSGSSDPSGITSADTAALTRRLQGDQGGGGGGGFQVGIGPAVNTLNRGAHDIASGIGKAALWLGTGKTTGRGPGAWDDPRNPQQPGKPQSQQPRQGPVQGPTSAMARSADMAKQAQYRDAMSKARADMVQRGQWQARAIGDQQKFANDVQAGVRQLAARQVQAQGRTPGRDRLAAQMRALRQMGLQI